MILIKKGEEPKEWIKYRLTHGVEYSAIPALKEALLKEQGCLCAYCMARIEMKTMKVEHLACRAGHPNKQLDYSNLLACCQGGEGTNERHCDTSKGNQEMSFSPLREECIKSLSYSSKGVVSSNNDKWEGEINGVLNLNTPILKDNRHEALRCLLDILARKGYTHSVLTKLLSDYQEPGVNGKRKPYCGIAIWHLQKKLDSTKRPI